MARSINLNIRKKLTKPFLFEEYVINKKTPQMIAKQLGCCSFSTVRRFLVKYNIHVRSLNEVMKNRVFSNKHKKNLSLAKSFKKIDRKILFSLYVLQKKTINEIAKLFGCSGTPIRTQLREYNIKIRNFSEANKGRKKPNLSSSLLGRRLSKEHRQNISKGLIGKMARDNNPNWIDGRTPIMSLIRNLKESQDWRKKVFKRDNYTCQECNKRGGYLEAHHIESFSKILSKFLNKYNQFSPIEDKEILVRLSITYESFWNINNGQTLCRPCHDLTKLGVSNGKK